MTSKEALETIANIELYHREFDEDEDFDGDWEYLEYTEYDGLVREVYKQEIDTIKQDLERLEVLEKAYKKVVESIVHYEYTKQQLENEKLKKEKEQIKQWIINKIKYLDKGVFLMSGERVKGAIEILNELLREVINNE